MFHVEHFGRGETMKGIDVSQYQTNVDWEKVKSSGVDFVIIRAGYGKYASQKDKMFESHYAGTKKAGLKVGAYWYSYATDVDSAKLEAKVCVSILKGKTFDFPIYFDMEEQKTFLKGVSTCSQIVQAFCSVLEGAGYFAGLYMSRSHLQNYVSEAIRKRYALWIAEYGSRLRYSGTYGMWQNGSTGQVDGISGYVDTDISYVDYPSIIKNAGLNGFGLEDESPAPKADVYIVKKGDTLTAIAKKYGTTVDAIVNANSINNKNLIYVGQKLMIYE